MKRKVLGLLALVLVVSAAMPGALAASDKFVVKADEIVDLGDTDDVVQVNGPYAVTVAGDYFLAESSAKNRICRELGFVRYVRKSVKLAPTTQMTFAVPSQFSEWVFSPSGGLMGIELNDDRIGSLQCQKRW